MRSQHIGHKIRGYYRVANLALKYSIMSKSSQEKMEALAFWDKHGISATMDAYKVSTPTLYRWKQLYHDYGVNGLIDKSKAPVGRNSRSANWDFRVIKFIADYRRRHYRCGAMKIYPPLSRFCLANDLACPRPCTISRIISDNKGFISHKFRRYVSVGKRSKAKAIARRPSGWYAKNPGDCLAIDNIHLSFKGKKYYAITCIDLYSRLAFTSVSTSISSKTAAEFCDAVTRVFPFEIKHVLSDNGSEFKKHFAKLLENKEITQWKIYPGKPQMNAVCERFNRTVKEECLTPYLSLLHYDKKTFLRKLCDWLYWYNAERAHHSLGYNTPMEYIEKHQNSHMLCDHTFDFPPFSAML